MSTWIDFKELRSQLKFPAVLQHYKVQLKPKGNRVTGFCPLPTHQGKRSSPSFSADLVRGIWQCFGCHAKGNVLDFATRMEGLNPDDPKELRKAALKIRDVFGLNGAGASSPPPAATPKATTNQKVLVNPPIDFELQTLDPEHPYLRERGFTDETIAFFGLGFCNRGMLKQRVAIPLHDPNAYLVGYAGRLTDDKAVSEANPKYKFPGGRERDGTMLEFRKSRLLYNLHRLKKKGPGAIVVEGFASVWWLHQHGFKNAVALIGSDCSDEQAKLILERVDFDGRIWIMPDGDDAGWHCAESCLRLLSPYRFVRWVKLKDGEQPTDYNAEELEAILNS
jgi:DNA primase